MTARLGLTAFSLAAALASAEQPPSAELTNGKMHVKIYLPDAKNGFYRGTRFDWAGTVSSLTANGHEYYGPWFTHFDPAVHDFVYRGQDIVAGPCSATVGPADEFAQAGFADAKVGGTFIKIGVGALRKPSDEKYDNYHLYEIANGGTWTVRAHRDHIVFVQNLDDAGASGYGYVYEKELRLIAGTSQMQLRRRLKNTGKKTIETTVYNHNFLVLDHQPPGPGLTISLPFDIKTTRPLDPRLAQVEGKQIRYIKPLEGEETVATAIEGYSSNAADHSIRIESGRLGAGMRIKSDRPLARESLWSIRSVLAMEPFIAIHVEPGAEFTWTTDYEYYAIPKP